MKIINLNSGNIANPTLLDKQFNKHEYVILQSGVYILSNSVIINEMRGSSQVKEMWGNSAILNISGENSITCKGYNILRINSSNKSAKITLNNTSTLITLPVIENNFNVYIKYYPVKVEGTKAIMYKAVHKIDGKFIADHDYKTEYVINKIIKNKVDKNTKISCAEGLHISHLSYALCFGSGWPDIAILECEVKIEDIIVAEDCDGKVRTSKLKVLREVPKQEYEQYL